MPPLHYSTCRRKPRQSHLLQVFLLIQMEVHSEVHQLYWPGMKSNSWVRQLDNQKFRRLLVVFRFRENLYRHRKHQCRDRSKEPVSGHYRLYSVVERKFGAHQLIMSVYNDFKKLLWKTTSKLSLHIVTSWFAKLGPERWENVKKLIVIRKFYDWD